MKNPKQRCLISLSLFERMSKNPKFIQETMGWCPGRTLYGDTGRDDRKGICPRGGGLIWRDNFATLFEASNLSKANDVDPNNPIYVTYHAYIPYSQRLRRDSMSKRITGSVYWIGNGRRTTTAVDVKTAFGNPDQAIEQVFFTEMHADERQQRVARLAYRQYQGKQFSSR
jgi:hypothetical protein